MWWLSLKYCCDLQSHSLTVVPVGTGCRCDGSVLWWFAVGGVAGVRGEVGVGQRGQKAGLYGHHRFGWRRNLKRESWENNLNACLHSCFIYSINYQLFYLENHFDWWFIRYTVVFPLSETFSHIVLITVLQNTFLHFNRPESFNRRLLMWNIMKHLQEVLILWLNL